MNRTSQLHPHINHQGFTLIELIIVITISGIVAVLAATMLGNQMLAFVDLTRRADLVDQGETAVRQLARDIRHALPNSLRVTENAGDAYLEFVPIIDAGRYREKVGDGSLTGDNDVLDFSAADTSFQVLGRMPSFSSGDQLVIYNIGQVDASGDPVDGANVYASVAPGTSTIPVPGSHVLAPSGTLSASGSILSFSSHQFAFESPQKRFYIVNQATSYFCDRSEGQLWRYQGYDFEASQANDYTVTPLSTASIKSTLIERVTECDFSYDAGNAQRAGLLTITLTVSEEGEQVRLVHQIHVDNAP